MIRNVAGSALDPMSVAIVTSGGTGFATADGGATWSPFGTLPGNALFMSSVWFDPLNERTLYAASVAPDPAATHLWRSLDAGATWASVEGPGFPSGIPVHVIQSDPGNGKALFAGTDFGVYVSQDGGASWARYGTGLPLVAVRDLYVAPDGSFLRAATFGRGVWELRGAADPVAPSINRDPMPVSVYAGAGATFTATANGSPAPALQWRKGGVDIPGATAPAYTTPPATAGDDGAAFSLRATNASGSATSGAALLTVLLTTAPAITLDPVGQTLPEGAQATFTGAATGGAAPDPPVAARRRGHPPRHRRDLHPGRGPGRGPPGAVHPGGDQCGGKRHERPGPPHGESRGPFNRGAAPGPGLCSKGPPPPSWSSTPAAARTTSGSATAWTCPTRRLPATSPGPPPLPTTARPSR